MLNLPDLVCLLSCPAFECIIPKAIIIGIECRPDLDIVLTQIRLVSTNKASCFTRSSQLNSRLLIPFIFSWAQAFKLRAVNKMYTKIFVSFHLTDPITWAQAEAILFTCFFTFVNCYRSHSHLLVRFFLGATGVRLCIVGLLLAVATG